MLCGRTFMNVCCLWCYFCWATTTTTTTTTVTTITTRMLIVVLPILTNAASSTASPTASQHLVSQRTRSTGRHPHNGIVKPFALGDPHIALNREALALLKDGKAYQTQIQDGTSGRGLVVQDVMAPAHVVWDRILDFNKYSQMVPKTVESKIYKTETMRNGRQQIWVKMKIGFPMMKLQFYIHHTYDPAKHSMIWTLDYNQKSDINDSCGYWYVIPHPDDPLEKTRIYYSVEVSMYNWVPQFIVDFMSRQALTDATAWVKKYSELEVPRSGNTLTSQQPLPTMTQQSSSAMQGNNGKSKSLGALLNEMIQKVTRQKKQDPKVGMGSERDTTPMSPRATGTATVGTIDVNQIAIRKIGMTRYALVFSVLSLMLYNIHLYFSQ